MINYLVNLIIKLLNSLFQKLLFEYRIETLDNKIETAIKESSNEEKQLEADIIDFKSKLAEYRKRQDDK